MRFSWDEWTGYEHEAPKLVAFLTWFEEEPKLQPTWNSLIRLLLAYRGDEPSREHVRRYQRDELAASGADECLLELMPLPSPSTGDWRYGGWSSLPWLQSRKEYKNHLLSRRIKKLQLLVTEHEPDAVIFYSKSYLEYGCEVARCQSSDFQKIDLPRKDGEMLPAFVRPDAPTTFVVTYHPTYFPATNHYFESLGRLLARGMTP